MLFLGERSGSALLQVNRVLSLEDFEGDGKTNRLTTEITGDEKPPGIASIRFLQGEEAFGRSGTSLAVDYDVSEPDSLSYVRIKLAKREPGGESSAFPADLSEMRYLSFWVNLQPAEASLPGDLSLELYEDTDGDGELSLKGDRSEQIQISRFMGLKEFQGWRKVTIPFSEFRRLHRWDRILEMRLVFDHRQRMGKGGLGVDRILAGANYPEAFGGQEIPMQNRVSSFKIENQFVNSEIKLENKSGPMTLTLTFVDPYLEEVRFEERRGRTDPWKRIHSFLDHTQGGVYETEVKWRSLPVPPSREGIWVRAVGISLFGGETELAGPYRVQID